MKKIGVVKNEIKGQCEGTRKFIDESQFEYMLVSLVYRQYKTSKSF